MQFLEKMLQASIAIKPASTLVQQKLAEVGRIELPVLGLDRHDNSTHFKNFNATSSQFTWTKSFKAMIKFWLKRSSSIGILI
jgi:hypothetical protein